MESQQLVADEVVAGGEVRGDSALPVEVLQDLGSAPVATGQRRRGHALLVDLEPLLAAAVAGVEVAGALIHPYHDGSLLVGPLLPDSADLASCLDGSTQVSAGAAVAHDLGVVDVHRGVVVRPLTLDGLGAGGRCEAFITSMLSATVEVR